MTVRRCHYLHQKGSDISDRLDDFMRPALCGRTQWGAVSGKPEEVTCKRCLKRLEVILAAERAAHERQVEATRLGSASYALGRMFGTHRRVYA